LLQGEKKWQWNEGSKGSKGLRWWKECNKRGMQKGTEKRGHAISDYFRRLIYNLWSIFYSRYLQLLPDMPARILSSFDATGCPLRLQLACTLSSRRRSFSESLCLGLLCCLLLGNDGIGLGLPSLGLGAAVGVKVRNLTRDRNSESATEEWFEVWDSVYQLKKKITIRTIFRRECTCSQQDFPYFYPVW